MFETKFIKAVRNALLGISMSILGFKDKNKDRRIYYFVSKSILNVNDIQTYTKICSHFR